LVNQKPGVIDSLAASLGSLAHSLADIFLH